MPIRGPPSMWNDASSIMVTNVMTIITRHTVLPLTMHGMWLNITVKQGDIRLSETIGNVI